MRRSPPARPSSPRPTSARRGPRRRRRTWRTRAGTASPSAAARRRPPGGARRAGGTRPGLGRGPPAPRGPALGCRGRPASPRRRGFCPKPGGFAGPPRGPGRQGTRASGADCYGSGRRLWGGLLWLRPSARYTPPRRDRIHVKYSQGITSFFRFAGMRSPGANYWNVRWVHFGFGPRGLAGGVMGR